jgi:hypothetical protein
MAVNDAESWRFVSGQLLRDGVNIFCRNAFRKATDQLRVVFREPAMASTRQTLTQ